MNALYGIIKEFAEPHINKLADLVTTVSPTDMYIYIALSIFFMCAGWLLATGWGDAANRFQVTLIYTFFFLLAGVSTVAVLLEVLAGGLLFLFKPKSAQIYYMSAAAGVSMGVLCGLLSWYLIRSVFQPWFCRVIGASMEGREDHLTDVRQIDKEIPQPLVVCHNKRTSIV
jgi:hypothetical protein